MLPITKNFLCSEQIVGGTTRRWQWEQGNPTAGYGRDSWKYVSYFPYCKQFLNGRWCLLHIFILVPSKVVAFKFLVEDISSAAVDFGCMYVFSDIWRQDSLILIFSICMSCDHFLCLAFHTTCCRSICWDKNLHLHVYRSWWQSIVDGVSFVFFSLSCLPFLHLLSNNGRKRLKFY